MTGGLGFVKDGINAQKQNRRMVTELHNKHFKSSKPKSDFSKKYKESKEVDAETLETIRANAKRENQWGLIKALFLITVAVTIVVVIYYLPRLLELYPR